MRYLVKAVQHALGAQPSLLGVFEWVFAAPFGALGQPLSGVSWLDQRDQVFDHQARIPQDGHVGLDHLVELCRIDVDVDLDGVDAELVQLPGDPVVPARANRHDEIAGHHGLVRIGGSVHSEQPALAIAARRKCSGLKVLYMTGYAADTTLQQARGASGAAILRKPFTMEDLARNVWLLLHG